MVGGPPAALLRGLAVLLYLNAPYAITGATIYAATMDQEGQSQLPARGCTRGKQGQSRSIGTKTLGLSAPMASESDVIFHRFARAGGESRAVFTHLGSTSNVKVAWSSHAVHSDRAAFMAIPSLHVFMEMDHTCHFHNTQLAQYYRQLAELLFHHFQIAAISRHYHQLDNIAASRPQAGRSKGL